MLSKPFCLRLNRLREELAKQDIACCLIESPIDLLYLTGQHFSCGTLCVESESEELFVDGRYYEQARSSFSKTTLMSDSALKEAFAKYKNVAFDSKSTSYERFLKLSSLTDAVFVPLPSLLKNVRSIKEPQEISIMKESAHLLWKGFEHLKSILHVGISEKQTALHFEIFCKNAGAEALAFDPIIAFGAHTAMPHHHCTDRILQPGDPVLIDIGVSLHGYRSDMTRMLFFSPVQEHVFKLYEIVQRAQKAALSACKPGVSVSLLDQAARAEMHKEGVEDLFVHSLGHGIGLETHEFPRLTSKGEDKETLLSPGMVVTIEPGLYTQGIGGARYEDTILITEQGYENFYEFTPATVFMD